jgi:hypothetical protein
VGLVPYAKAMRMVGGLEDLGVGDPRSGIPPGEIRALAEIFERNSWLFRF